MPVPRLSQWRSSTVGGLRTSCLFIDQTKNLIDGGIPTLQMCAFMYLNISFSRLSPSLTKKVYMLRTAGYNNKFSIMISLL